VVLGNPLTPDLDARIGPLAKEFEFQSEFKIAVFSAGTEKLIPRYPLFQTPADNRPFFYPKYLQVPLPPVEGFAVEKGRKPFLLSFGSGTVPKPVSPFPLPILSHLERDVIESTNTCPAHLPTRHNHPYNPPYPSTSHGGKLLKEKDF
jgi:hypothetical protein